MVIYLSQRLMDAETRYNFVENYAMIVLCMRQAQALFIV
jgi:hypothetical protein